MKTSQVVVHIQVLSSIQCIAAIDFRCCRMAIVILRQISTTTSAALPRTAAVVAGNIKENVCLNKNSNNNIKQDIVSVVFQENIQKNKKNN